MSRTTLDKQLIAPQTTAVRAALWRALHVEADAPPHVFEDDLGLKLAAPDDGWRSRPDMSHFTRAFRAAVVARDRFVEDLVLEQAVHGVGQYVILGAGLDTFAQRRAKLASRLRVFEIDQPGPQAWKRRRLAELGLGVPPFLRLVPVDFEAGDAWWERLVAAGFDPQQPAIVASPGAGLNLAKDVLLTTLRQLASLAPGSMLVVSFLLPIEMLTVAREAGFKHVQHVSAAALAERYFAGRADDLRPPNNSEELLVAIT